MSKKVKNSKQSERLSQLMRHYGYSKKNEFAKKIGVSTSLLSHYLNGREIKEVFAFQIQSAFKEISVDWLLTGNGDMFTDMKKENFQPDISVEYLKKKIELLEKENSVLREQNEFYKEIGDNKGLDTIVRSGDLGAESKRNNRTK